MLIALVGAELVPPKPPPEKEARARRRLHNLVLILVILILAIKAPAPPLHWFLRFAALLGISLVLNPGERDREWKLIVVTFLFLLLAGAQTEAPTFAIPFVAFLLLLPAGLSHTEKAGSPRRDLGMGGGLFLLTMGLFLAIPRFGRGVAGSFLPSGRQSAKMQDRMTLDSVTDLKLSQRIAMRVQVDGRLPVDVKWRGSSLNQFDGATWTGTMPIDEVFRQSADGIIEILWQGAAKTPFVRQRFTLEPGLSSYLFALARPARLNPEGSFHFVYAMDSDLFLNFTPGRATHYTVFSAPPDGLPPDQEPTPALYLALPDIDPRVKELAKTVTLGANSRLAVLKAIESWFHRDFAYSLAVSRETDLPPLTDFLLRNRQGHCEFFASGMAVMGRLLGIPTRVVQGFMGGDFSALDSSYLVRLSDAHAWVEAFVPERGWVAFDPTPSETEPPFLTRLANRLEHLWTRVVIDYGPAEQRALIRAAGRRLLPLAAASLLVLVPLLLVRKFAVKGRSSPSRPKPAAVASRQFGKALRLLTRAGFAPSPFETPRELTLRLSTLTSFRELVKVHEQTTYAGQPTDPRRGKLLLRQLRQDIKDHR